MKMNPEVKSAWVAALRSGEYEQGVGRLNQDGKLCCLGVLCEVAIKQFDIDLDVEKDCDCDPTEGNLCDATVSYDGEGFYLPPRVAVWSGMSRAGYLEEWVHFEGQAYDALSGLNDTGMSFAKIADVIEKCL